MDRFNLSQSARTIVNHNWRSLAIRKIAEIGIVIDKQSKNKIKYLTASELQWGAEIALPNTRSLQSTPHIIGGKYPCRSVAYIPRMIFKKYASEHTNKNFKVIDPFMGSGTTAIEANEYTSEIYGLEVDPYARLIATVSNLKYTKSEIQQIELFYNTVLNTWETIKPKKSLQPLLANIRYWFNENEYTDLLKLKTAIFDLTSGNEKIMNFLLAVFAEIIRACSKAERQSLKPYISKRFPKEPKPVLPTFAKALEKYVLSVSDSLCNLSDGIVWLEGDATNFKTRSQINIAVTSPPYINALDYTRCIKLESCWLGLMDDAYLSYIKSQQIGEASRIKSVNIDTNTFIVTTPYLKDIREIDFRRFQTVQAYFQDISSNLKSMYSALVNGGEYHMIIGNSAIRGFYIPTHQIIAEIAQDLGFSWDGYFKYPIRDHRTSIPRNGNGGKIAYEHVIKLVKRV